MQQRENKKRLKIVIVIGLYFVNANKCIRRRKKWQIAVIAFWKSTKKKKNHFILLQLLFVCCVLRGINTHTHTPSQLRRFDGCRADELWHIKCTKKAPLKWNIITAAIPFSLALVYVYCFTAEADGRNFHSAKMLKRKIDVKL